MAQPRQTTKKTNQGVRQFILPQRPLNRIFLILGIATIVWGIVEVTVVGTTDPWVTMIFITGASILLLNAWLTYSVNRDDRP